MCEGADAEELEDDCDICFHLDRHLSSKQLLCSCAASSL